MLIEAKHLDHDSKKRNWSEILLPRLRDQNDKESALAKTNQFGIDNPTEPASSMPATATLDA
jgi:hypothetical protein